MDAIKYKIKKYEHKIKNSTNPKDIEKYADRLKYYAEILNHPVRRNPKPDRSGVTFYFIRHGFSCDNLVNQKFKSEGTEKWNYIRNHGERDTNLNDYGIRDSRIAGSNFFHDKQIDKIIVSPLARAIQTAHLMFPGNKSILIAPYLKELGTKPASDPYEDLVIQADERLDRLDPALQKRLNLQYRGFTLRNGREGDLPRFIRWYMDSDLPRGNVAVVTHSGLMVKDLGIQFPHNNAVYRLQVDSSHRVNSESIKRNILKVYNGIPETIVQGDGTDQCMCTFGDRDVCNK